MLPSARGQIQQREAPLSWRFLSPSGGLNSQTAIPFPRRVLANYIGGTDRLTTWQSRVSAAVNHLVAGGVGCALPDLFGDGFE